MGASPPSRRTFLLSTRRLSRGHLPFWPRGGSSWQVSVSWDLKILICRNSKLSFYAVACQCRLPTWQMSFVCLLALPHSERMPLPKPPCLLQHTADTSLISLSSIHSITQARGSLNRGRFGIPPPFPVPTFVNVLLRFQGPFVTFYLCTWVNVIMLILSVTYYLPSINQENQKT